MNPRRTKRALTAFGITTISAAALAAPASAHVRLTPDTAAPGSYAVLTFKVPTESATASTTKIEVDLPTSTPFGSVDYQPVPGWKTDVTNSRLPKPLKTDDGLVNEAPTKITWTATDGGIKPGQFQLFSVSAGPIPNTGSMQLNAKQTYSDGKVVNWNEVQKGSTEPDTPAPILYIKDKAPDASPTMSQGAQASTPSATSSSSSKSADATGRWLGAGGIVLGAIALVTAVWAATRHR